MAKYLVETYYTCSFKVNHYLENIGEKELANLEKRDDGKYEILDIKLDNRKTKNLTNNSTKVENKLGNNEKILISLPSGGWEFYLLKNKNNYTLETVKSIYIEDDNTKKNTSQIIIIGETSNTGAKINWCFKKSNL